MGEIAQQGQPGGPLPDGTSTKSMNQWFVDFLNAYFAGEIKFGDTSYDHSLADTGLTRNGAGTLSVTDGQGSLGAGNLEAALATLAGIINSGISRFDGQVSIGGASTSKRLQFKEATTTSAGVSGASVTLTNFIPAGSIVLGVICKNSTVITGAGGFTGYSIGDGSDVDKWGANIVPTLDNVTGANNFTAGTPAIYTAATSIVLTAVGANFASGDIITTLIYYTFGT